MIYIFGATIIYTFVKEKDKLLSAKRNLILFFFLSVIGMTLGVIYIINPYLPSITLMLQKYSQ